MDDCSTDESYQIVKNWGEKSIENLRLSIVQLSKNSGSHIAITAGLNISRGDFTIIMASDGQDPASVITELILEWRAGNNLVLASREDNLDHGFFGKLASKMAWKLMNWATNVNMPETGSDLLGMDRSVLDAFNKMDERNTTFIFRILSVGYKQKEISYVKRVRAGGVSKWSTLKKIGIMFDAIAGFSSRPLQLITKFGFAFFIILTLRWAWVIVSIYVLDQPTTELTIVLNTVFTALAVQVLILGFIGDYIWRILDESRKRPLYEVLQVDGEVFEKPKEQ